MNISHDANECDDTRADDYDRFHSRTTSHMTLTNVMIQGLMIMTDSNRGPHHANECDDTGANDYIPFEDNISHHANECDDTGAGQ